MVKILHTGDCHFGLTYQKVVNESSKAKIIEARMKALRNVVQIANKEECDIIVVAGDLFENEKVSQKLQKEVCIELEQFSGQAVMILPGNHDFYSGEDSKFWNNFEEFSGDKVILFKEYKPYPITIGNNELVFYPCICPTKHSENNALQWISDEDVSADSINIGIAHGAIEGLSLDKEGKYYTMNLKELEKSVLDMWLLGHTHIPYPEMNYNMPEKRYKVFNAGTHQQTDFANNTDGSVFIIEINEEKQIVAERIQTNEIKFITQEIIVNHGESLVEILQEELKNLDPEKTVVRLNVKGIVDVEEYENRLSICEDATRKFLYAYKENVNELRKEITVNMIDAETLEGSVENALLHLYESNMELLNLTFDVIKECRGEE